MKKLLLWADPHIYPHNAFSSPTTDGLTTHLHEIMAIFRWVHEVIREEQPDLVIGLGDYYHTHDHVDPQSQHVAEMIFREHVALVAGGAAGDFSLLLGNHEVYNENAGIHTLSFMRDRVIPTQTIRDRILYMPHTNDIEGAVMAANARADEYDLVMMHLPLNGALRHLGIPEVNGIDPHSFPDGKHIFAGHYHRPCQVVATPECYARVVGSITTRTFTDSENAGIERGIDIVEWEERGPVKVRRIPGPHHSKYETVHVRTEEERYALDMIEDKKRTFVKVYYYNNYPIETLEGTLAKFKRAILAPGVSQDKRKKGDEEGDQYGFDVNIEEEAIQYLTDAKWRDEETVEIVKGIIKAGEDTTGDVQHSNIRFDSVRMEGFMSFKDGAYFHLRDRGLVLIEGVNQDDPGAMSNGSGKSTLIEALFWCLYDRTLRGLSKADVGWRNGRSKRASGCMVEVEFHIDDDHYLVRRSRKHKTYKTGLTIEKNGDDSITPRLAADAQIELLRILGVTHDALQHLSIMTQGLSHRFIDLNDGDRKKLIESILGLDALDRMSDLARDRKRKTAVEMGSASAEVEVRDEEVDRVTKKWKAAEEEIGDLDSKRREVEALAERKKTIEHNRSEFEGRVEEARKELEAKRGEVNRLREEHAEVHRKEVERLRGLASDLRKREEEYRLEYGPLSKREEELKAEIETHKQVQRELDVTENDLQERAGDLRLRIHGLREEVVRIETANKALAERQEKARKMIEGGKCPTCFQPLNEAHDLHREAGLTEDAEKPQTTEQLDAEVERIKRDVESTEQEIARNNAAWKEEEQAIQTIKDRIKVEVVEPRENLDEKVKAAQKLISQADKSVRDAENTAEEGSDRLAEAMEEVSGAEAALDQLGRLVKDCASRIAEIGEEEQSIRESIRSAESRMEHLKEEVREAHKRRCKAGDRKRVAEVEEKRSQIVAGLFSPTGIRARLLSGAVEFLNVRLAEYSDVLIGKDAVVIHSQTELKDKTTTDKITVELTSGKSYLACSSGERRRADLVVQLALNALARVSTGLTTNILVCDEIDDKLDRTGMEALADVLRMKADEGLSVFLVTQHSFLRGLVPDRVSVVKSNGVSALAA